MIVVFTVGSSPEGSPSASEEGKELLPQPRLALYIKGPGTSSMSENEILLSDPNATIFKYVQLLLSLSNGSQIRGEKFKRVWEPTYTIIYKELREEDSGITDPVSPAQVSSPGITDPFSPAQVSSPGS